MGEGKAVLKIPPEFIEQIKSRLNLVDLVNEHVVLRKNGSNHTGLCPFHSERSPSFSVTEQKQLYHCYGCHAGGDLVKFVMEIEGLSFPEAVKELAIRAQIPIPENLKGAFRGDPGTRSEQQSQEEIYYRLNRFVALHYRKRLENDARARAYLSERKVNAAIESEFYLGVSGNEWDWLAKTLAAAKVPMDAAERLGLIRKSERGSGDFFDLFRERLMFPIQDRRGRVIAFGGRILPGAAEPAPKDSDRKVPKYLNSPESPLFQKSKTLYGMFQAMKHIRDQDEAIVVEGYFDVMGMAGAGFLNSVATCGTALTQDHLRTLLRFGKKVTLLFDGDRAGQEAMERGMLAGLDLGIALYGAVLPEGLDPDEFVAEKGRDAMADLLKGAQPILDRRIAELAEAGRTNMDVRTQNLKQVAGWLKAFRDPVGRSLRVESAARQFQVAAGLIWETMGEAAPAQRSIARPLQTARSSGNSPTAPISSREKLLVLSLLNPQSAKLWIETEARLPKVSGGLPGARLSDLFVHPALRKFTESLLDQPGITADELSRTVEKAAHAMISGHVADASSDANSGLRNVLIEILMNAENVPDMGSIRTALLQSLQQVWARFSQQVRTAMVDAESRNDSGNQDRLMQEYLDLQRRMKELSSFYE